MRYSLASQALCGAVTVSALAVPSRAQHRHADLVDLSNWTSFPTLDPKEILDNADDAIRKMFDDGLFNDGPMDDQGNFLGRPLVILDNIQKEIKDSLEDFNDQIKENLGDQAQEWKDFKDDLKDQFGDWKFGNKNPIEDVADALRVPHTEPAKGGHTKIPQGGSQSSQPLAQPPTQPPKGDSLPLSGDGANKSAATCNPSNPQIRVEWDSYSASDRKAFVQAIKCLQGKPSGGNNFPGSTNRYEDLASVHRGMTANIHQTASFLVWHRYFVWVFEQLLRDECAFDRAMPWWDETKHAGNFAKASIFTDDYFGHLPLKTSDNQGTCIVSGEFAGDQLHVGPGSANQEHCLSRAADESQTAQCNKDFTNSCLSRNAYEDFRNCFELGPHGYGHNGIGAVMAEVSSSVGDPIFFMHHTFVDHTFRVWQNGNPERHQTISGCADSANPCTKITLDTKLSVSGIRPDITVRDALSTLSGTLCYRYDY